MKTKKLIFSLTIAVLLLAMLTGVSEANVQSRPDASALVNTTASNFFQYIRKMETSFGPMGLNATVDDTGTETSSSNNIDVHMIKNTEWGTVAMLADSSYGAPKLDTTTGNAYGVMNMGKTPAEYVAGIWDTDNSYNTNIYNAADKYKNVYTSETSIPGDATLETRGWRKGSYSDSGYFVSKGREVFMRGCSPTYYPEDYGVFYFYGYSGISGSSRSFSCGCCVWDRTLKIH